jgi:hypothetical protein
MLTATTPNQGSLVAHLNLMVKDCFAPWSWQELPVEPEWAVRPALRGPSVLRSRQAVVRRDLRSAAVRAVSLRGGHVEIFNLLVFPHEPQTAPLLVAEVFLLRGQVKVVFFDLPYVGTDEQTHAHVTRELQTWGHGNALPHEAPPWATRYSTGHYVYDRDLGDDAPVRIEATLSQTITSWLNLNERPPAPRTPCGTHERVQRFKREHIEEAPNLGFLAALFGADWAPRYMQDFLYQ